VDSLADGGCFAITRGYFVCKKDMDLFSVRVLGMVTSLGGGTIRKTLVLSVRLLYW